MISVESSGWIAIFSPFATPFVAAVVGMIAYSQYRIAKDKIRLDLFDKRFNVYNRVDLFLKQVAQRASLDYNALPDLDQAIRESHFLFDQKVTDYLEELRLHALRSKHQQTKSEDLEKVTPEKSEAVKSHLNEIKWLLDQHQKLHTIFVPYLKISRK